MKIVVGATLVLLCSLPALALDFGADTPLIPSQLTLGPGFVAGLAAQGTYFNNTENSASGPHNVPPTHQRTLAFISG